jgi:penicillin-binding protein 2
MSSRLVRQRIALFHLLVIVGFIVLTVQLWRVQIVGGADYQALARENSIRLETIDAPRGIIYDRHGAILVRNRPNFRATMLPALVASGHWQLWSDSEWEEATASLRTITDMLEVSFPDAWSGPELRAAFRGATGTMRSEDIDKLCQQGEILRCYSEALISAPYRPVTILKKVPRETAFRVMENSIKVPALAIVSESQRDYLHGPLYAHLLGYELPIPQYMLDQQTRFTTNPYLMTDHVGMAGIEAGYEDNLRGSKGARLVEKNVLGQPIRTMQEHPATPGHNLFLTVDTELQLVVAEALREGMESVGSQEGVAIVMNPNTGEVLSMVSLPTYDNNIFVGTIDAEVYGQLNEDPMKPMFNRAVSGTYPPGSIYKIIPAAGALADGVITRDTIIHDPGSIFLPNQYAPDDPSLAQEFVCWLRTGHGDENVIDALAHSCDVYFYQVGGGYLDEFQGLGINSLAKWSTAFGLGEPTYIRLPGEALGHVPTPQWKRLTWQQSWVTGDTYNMSIGQGDVLVTPLQILNATTAIANGGVIYEPQLVYQIQGAGGEVVQAFAPRILRHVNVPSEHLATVAEGMRGAISWEDGTAYRPFAGAIVNVAGKTGTAEYCERLENEDGTVDCKLDQGLHQLTHAWFTAYAPYERPEIALVVFIGGNGEYVIQGSEVAAPIARRIIDYYFTRYPNDLVLPAEPDDQPLEGALEQEVESSEGEEAP